MSWLKFDITTPEKPEVLAITIAMGWDDPDLTVGKLIKVWRWFDAHTVDGNATRVTLALLDRIVGVTGFATAMQSAGWLLVDGAGIILPNFENHNGKTAKDRALTAKRAANYRSNDKSNAPTVTNALPREDKIREDKNKENRGTARGSRLPPDFICDFDFARQQGIIDVATETAKFFDYWNSKPGQNGTKLDWAATWRNWCRAAKTSNPAQNKADVSRQTVSSKPGIDPTLIKLAEDRARCAPMPESVKNTLKLLKSKPKEILL